MTYIEQYFTNELRRALSRALVPPTKVFRRLPVNKTIFLNHASLQRRSANTYTWDFPDVTKFRVAVLIRYRRKQCGSGIRTIIRIRLKSYSVRPCPDICRYATFHPKSMNALLSNLANRQTDGWLEFKCTFSTDSQTDKRRQKHLPPPFFISGFGI